MYEAGKAVYRRLSEPGFVGRYIKGTVIDIGAGNDPISGYAEFFPLATHYAAWDKENGDAQEMASVRDEFFDTVHSSHTLEHMRDPAIALGNWFRIVAPNGHLIVVVPDEDMYEKGMWPSIHNHDHKHSFTVWKERSWCPASINLLDLLRTLGPRADIVKVQRLVTTFRHRLPKDIDQTMSIVGECAIEVIVRKREANERV